MLHRLLILIAIVFSTAIARADEFADKLDLKPLQTISVQHRQTIKTFDSYARQVISEITGKSSIDKQSPIYTVLDMTFSPEKYTERNIVKVKNAVLGKEFKALESLDPAERKRIADDGTISLKFWAREDVRRFLEDQMSTAAFKSKAIGQLDQSANTLSGILGGRLPTVAIIAPPPGKADDTKWRKLSEIEGTLIAEIGATELTPQTAPIAGYEKVELRPIVFAVMSLQRAWVARNADEANKSIKELADLLPEVNPAVYPPMIKRKVEVIYNRLAKLTVPGSALYFIAFVLLIISMRSGFVGVRVWALRLMLLSFVVHTLAIGVRWWLISATHGNWFDSIPIKNQFESVLFSAWFGALLGLVLELIFHKGFFGVAASFVGWLSLGAIFVTPYVTGTEIGAEIGQVQGVLMSYWLYIHVTMVVASYALIGMSFALGVWWLIRYFGEFKTLAPQASNRVSIDALPRSEQDPFIVAGNSGAALTFFSTLQQVLFFIRPKTIEAERALPIETDRTKFLARLDQSNLVILQLAFWVLGVGIILGAVWADMSWGRPWGWDAKETFALLTWIVYLIVVHLRVATENKAWWTAVLSIIGFFVMLFNWIGVNFFIESLHGYA